MDLRRTQINEPHDKVIDDYEHLRFDINRLFVQWKEEVRGHSRNALRNNFKELRDMLKRAKKDYLQKPWPHESK